MWKDKTYENKHCVTARKHMLQSSTADANAIQGRLRCSNIEVITTNILRSVCPLRNIHITNGNGYFTFYADGFFPLSLPGRLRTIYELGVL